MKRYFFSAIAAGFLMAGAALPQVEPPPGSRQAEDKAHYEARQQEFNSRINQGLRSGTLNQAQASRMRAQDRAINQQALRMKARNGGLPLDRAQDRRIHHEMNRQSAHIYRQKH